MFYVDFVKWNNDVNMKLIFIARTWRIKLCKVCMTFDAKLCIHIYEVNNEISINKIKLILVPFYYIILTGW